MATFDEDWLSEEDLDNIDNNNKGDDDDDEGSSNNEEMNKLLKIGKLNGKTKM